MKTPNEKETDKRISSLLSAIDRQAVEPDKQFLDELETKSTTEFLACCGNTAGPSENTVKAISIWRTIMRSRVTKLATAAVIIIAAMIIVHQSGGSVDLTTIAIADISQAMTEQPWMHMISRGFQNGAAANTEVWVNYEKKIVASKVEQGNSQLWEIRNRRKYEFDALANTVTVEYIDEKDFPSNLSSPAAAIEAMYEGFRSQGAKITTRNGTLDGQKVQFQDIVLSSGGNHTQSLTLSIEPQSKLLVASELKVTDPNGKTVAGAEMTYSYPRSGPTSIYDLGVQTDATLIDKLPKEDYQTIWDSYRQNRNDTTRQYIAVTTQANPSLGDVIRTVGVDYKSDRNHRIETHDVFKSGEGLDEFWPQYKEQLGDSFDSLLAWTANRFKQTEGWLSVFIYDGQYSTNAIRKVKGQWRNTGKHYSPADPGMPIGCLGQLGWPEIGKAGQIIDDDHAKENDLICIERLQQGLVNAGTVSLPARVLFYLDPKKEYVCVRKITERCPDAEWQQDKNWLDGAEADKVGYGSITVRDTTEVIQAPNGHWYPKVIVIKQSGIREDYKDVPLEVTNIKTVYLQTDPEFPADIFNAEKLPGQ